MTATIPPSAAARRSDYRMRPRSRSGCNRQCNGAAFGFQRGLDQLTRLAFAAAAARGAAGAGLHVFERARTARDRTADVMVGNGLADANVHGALRGGIRDGRHLNANANDCQQVLKQMALRGTDARFRSGFGEKSGHGALGHGWQLRWPCWSPRTQTRWVREEICRSSDHGRSHEENPTPISTEHAASTSGAK